MKSYMRLFFILYLCGFIAGILCCNYLVRQSGYDTSMLSLYMAGGIGTSVTENLLFWRLLTKRGVWFAVYMISGVTPFGIPMVIGGLLWLGFLGGNLLTSFLLEYGVKGVAVNFISLFPQMLFYIPAVLFMFFFITQMSQKYWGKGKREKADYKAYLFFMTGIFVLFLLGLFMESYVNPNMIEMIADGII